MTVHGIDISHWNPSLVALPAYDFVFLKATQGKTYTDPTFVSRWAYMKEHGKIRGAYHFMSMKDSPDDQVTQFDWVVDIEPGDMIALDFETDQTWQQYANMDIAHMASNIMHQLRAQFPDNRVVLYCNKSDYARFVLPYAIPVMDGLWIAAPSGTANIPYVFWQHAQVNGVDLNQGNFDTVDDLREWASMVASNPFTLPSNVLAPDGRPYTYGELIEWNNRFINQLVEREQVQGTFTITGSGTVGQE